MAADPFKPTSPHTLIGVYGNLDSPDGKPFHRAIAFCSGRMEPTAPEPRTAARGVKAAMLASEEQNATAGGGFGDIAPNSRGANSVMLGA